MPECPICFTQLSDQLYQPEWSDIPTKVIYSCRYGCTILERPLTNEEEQEYIEDLMSTNEA